MVHSWHEMNHLSQGQATSGKPVLAVFKGKLSVCLLRHNNRRDFSLIHSKHADS